MQLVAFNAKDSDNAEVSIYGGLENCSSVNEFIGKINSE